MSPVHIDNEAHNEMLPKLTANERDLVMTVTEIKLGKQREVSSRCLSLPARSDINMAIQCRRLDALCESPTVTLNNVNW